MKKTIVSLVVILVVGYVGTTLYFRSHTKSQLQQAVSILDHALSEMTQGIPGPRFTAGLRDYKAGMLLGSANLNISMKFSKNSTARYGEFNYDLPITIYYGPFVFQSMQPAAAQVSAQLQLPEEMSNTAKQQLSADSVLPMLNLDLLMHYDSSVNLVATVPPFKIKPKRMPGTFEWQGLVATDHISGDFSRVQGDLEIKPLNLNSPFASASIARSTVNYDTQLSKFGLWTGDSTMTFPSIKMSTRGQSVVELDGLNTASNIKLNPKQRMVSHLQLAFKSLSIMHIGKIGPSKFDLNVTGLDPTAVVKIQVLSQEARGNQLRRMKPDQRRQFMLSLHQQFLKLLNNGEPVSLKSSLDLALPQGLIKYTLSANLKSDPSIKRVIDLRDQVVGDLFVQMPVGMVDEYIYSQAMRKLRAQQYDRPSKVNLHQRGGDTATSAPAAAAAQATATTTASVDTTPTAPAQSGAISAGDRQGTAPMTKQALHKLAQEKADNQIKKLLAKKILIKEGNAYILKLHYDHGKVSVHGQPFSPKWLP